jgi:hypothetical protein
VAVKVDLSLLDVSLVDARPAELLLTTLEGLRLEMRKGNCAGIPFEITSVRLNNIQVGRAACGTWDCGPLGKEAKERDDIGQGIGHRRERGMNS